MVGSDIGRTLCAQRVGDRTSPINQYFDRLLVSGVRPVSELFADLG